jgi:hypothetical protein
LALLSSDCANVPSLNAKPQNVCALPYPRLNVRWRTDGCPGSGYFWEVTHGLGVQASGLRHSDLLVVARVRPAKAGVPSPVMLARTYRSGIFELLTAEAWAGALGYAPAELNGRSLRELMRLELPAAKDVVGALLGERETLALEVSVRCKNERRKRFRLYRRFDAYEEAVFMVADELADEPGPARAAYA